METTGFMVDLAMILFLMVMSMTTLLQEPEMISYMLVLIATQYKTLPLWTTSGSLHYQPVQDQSYVHRKVSHLTVKCLQMAVWMGQKPCIYVCKKGFLLQGPRERTRLDESWDGINLRCQPLHCPTLLLSDNDFCTPCMPRTWCFPLCRPRSRQEREIFLAKRTHLFCIKCSKDKI